MKAGVIAAFVLVAVATMFMTVGGALDGFRFDANGVPVFVVTQNHAWHDGIFIMLLAIVLLLVSYHS